MRKDKHNNVRFVSIDKAAKLVNDPRFTGLTEFDNETFEVMAVQFKYFIFLHYSSLHAFQVLNIILFKVTSQKKSITYDLPLQIGFWTYQHAKLTMLSFYYDVIDRFISRDDFSLLEMDTGKFRFFRCFKTLFSAEFFITRQHKRT